MFLRSRPTDEFVAGFIARQEQLPFSYSRPGATQGQPPAGFTPDHNRIQLGTGQQTYERAVAALQNWQQFQLGWLTIRPPGKRLVVGTTVAVEANTFGFWSLNAARVVYVLDACKEGQASFGFAYGTLPDHVERGEERFLVEWCGDNSVWYDIYAFSRPRHVLAWAGFPITRMLQRRFVRDSQAAMLLAAA